jgi:histone H2B
MLEFNKYIYEVLKKVHPDIAISGEALDMMNTFITDMMLKLAHKASKHNKIRNKNSPLVEPYISDAVCEVFPEDMAFQALLSAFRSQNRESVEVLCDRITKM